MYCVQLAIKDSCDWRTVPLAVCISNSNGYSAIRKFNFFSYEIIIKL